MSVRVKSEAGGVAPTRRRRALFAVLTALIVFVAIEAALIVLEPLVFRGLYEYDPDMGFRVRPYAHGSNRFGFPDRDYPLAKPAGTIRVMILGDSFNWAGGTQGNYTALVEQMFEQRLGAGRVEIITAGYPMTHTAEQLVLLEKYGLRYRPDFLLLGFFMGNDFDDADPNRKRIVAYDTPLDIDPRYELVLFGYAVVPRSRLINILRYKYVELRERMNAGWIRPARAAGNGAQTPGFAEKSFYLIKRNQLRFFARRAHDENVYRANIAHVRESLIRMKRLLAEHSAGFAVAVYPDQLQVDAALRGQVLEAFGLEEDAYDMGIGNRILREQLEAEGVAYLDLHSLFANAADPGSLYIEGDTHWNAAGNRLAAQAVYAFLVEQLPLAGPASPSAPGPGAGDSPRALRRAAE